VVNGSAPEEIIEKLLAENPRLLSWTHAA